MSASVSVASPSRTAAGGHVAEREAAATSAAERRRAEVEAAGVVASGDAGVEPDGSVASGDAGVRMVDTSVNGGRCTLGRKVSIAIMANADGGFGSYPDRGSAHTESPFLLKPSVTSCRASDGMWRPASSSDDIWREFVASRLQIPRVRKSRRETRWGAVPRLMVGPRQTTPP